MFTKMTSQVHEPLILRANNARIAVDKVKNFEKCYFIQIIEIMRK